MTQKKYTNKTNENKATECQPINEIVIAISVHMCYLTFRVYSYFYILYSTLKNELLWMWHRSRSRRTQSPFIKCKRLCAWMKNKIKNSHFSIIWHGIVFLFVSSCGSQVSQCEFELAFQMSYKYKCICSIYNHNYTSI